jgi:predicted GNAT family acetyltransferase
MESRRYRRLLCASKELESETLLNNCLIGYLREALERQCVNADAMFLVAQTQDQVHVVAIRAGAEHVLLIASPLSSLQAAELLLKLIKPGEHTNLVTCTRKDADGVLAAWPTLKIKFRDAFMVLSKPDFVKIPHLADSDLELAGVKDLDMCAVVYQQFVDDIQFPPVSIEESGKLIKSRIEQNHLYMFKHRSVPVAFISYQVITDTNVRINFVFTERAYRGKGFATHMVNNLCLNLFEFGFTRSFLYVDLAQPAPMAVYVKSGFKHHGDIVFMKEYIDNK